MAMIEVDFDVYKELTVRRASEAVTYNQVIRELLNLPAEGSAAEPPAPEKGCVFDGVFLADGTQFRKTYKGRTFTAEIKNGRWISEEGQTRSSPSEAAVKITGNSVNGWRFWKVKRPTDPDWRLLDELH